jgi:putative flavoprotein involved in K+ transport
MLRPTDMVFEMTPASATAKHVGARRARVAAQSAPWYPAANAGPEPREIERHQAIVVGAGSAGLAAAFALQRRGFDTLVIDSTDAVGGSWRSRYAELRLNSWRPMSKLQGRGMPRNYGRYPARDDVIAYLEAFAREHAIPMRFGTRVVKVDRDGQLWRLDTSSRRMLCRYLVVATGWDTVPVMPSWPGAETFTKELIHSSAFVTATTYAGRDVLVVGAGNSGFDIASHLVRAGARVTMSMRTPPSIAKREVFGIPGQPLLVFAADRLPESVADAVFRCAQWTTFGNLKRYGIPRASMGAYAAHRLHGRSPAVDDGFVDALKRGAARMVGPVDRLIADEVVLVDGTCLRPNAVICATGYRRGLESLVGHLGVLSSSGVPINYRGAPEHPRAPRLYFCGMHAPFSGQIRLGAIHARRIARAAAVDRRMRYRVHAGF